MEADIQLPLPVTLLSYQAAKEGATKVKLTWETSMEVNNHHFIIERSADGRNFIAMASIGSKGNGNTKQS